MCTYNLVKTKWEMVLPRALLSMHALFNTLKLSIGETVAEKPVPEGKSIGAISFKLQGWGVGDFYL